MPTLSHLFKVTQITGGGARTQTQVCLCLGAELVSSMPYYLMVKCSKQKLNKTKLTLSEAL